MPFLNRLAVTPLVLASLASLPAAAQDVGITVKPVGVAVVSEAFPADRFQFGALNGLTGTRVALMLTAGEHPIVGVEPIDSDVEAFVDSTGRDLMQEPETPGDGFGAMAGIQGLPGMSDDHRLALVEVAAPRSPAAGADSVTLTGEISVQTAAGSKSVETGMIDLKPGPVKAGDHTFTLESIEPQQMFDEATVEVAFKLTGNLAKNFASLRLLDEAGDAIETGGQTTMQWGDTLNVSYTLRRDSLDRANLELTVWQDLRTVRVPLDLTVRAGGF